MTVGVVMADTVLRTLLLKRLSALLDAPSPVIVDAVVSATDCVAESALTSTFGQLVLVAVKLRSLRTTPESRLASPLRKNSCFAALKSA